MTNKDQNRARRARRWAVPGCALSMTGAVALWAANIWWGDYRLGELGGLLLIPFVAFLVFAIDWS